MALIDGFARVALLALLLSACTAAPPDPMRTPVIADTPKAFQRALLDLQAQLPTDDYIELTDAVGWLKTHDTARFNVDDFYASLYGLTPQQIIARARALEPSQ